ncbi:MAG: hypothetical protein KME64_03300 [Scytonematopsis contorta HA4267-MV1]|nr:hypothetical protein [Scytonematopsis contorta HA4267-MV1]
MAQSARTEVQCENELSYEEQRDREHLERIIERSFYEAGKALKEIRDRRLYRSTHKTFESYCQDRFGYNNSRSYQMMDAATVVENLQKVPQFVEVFPTAEGQVRPLTKLEPEEQVICWQKAVEEAGNKVPSGKIVKNVVDTIRERTKVPNPYHLGEVCVFIPKDNPDLRGKKGCWGIVTHVGDFSCSVETWDGEYTAKIENLSSLELTDEDCKFMQDLCLRLQRLYKLPMRDSTADCLIAFIGKHPKPYLTEYQEKLLATTESFYHVAHVTKFI